MMGIKGIFYPKTILKVKFSACLHLLNTSSPYVIFTCMLFDFWQYECLADHNKLTFTTNWLFLQKFTCYFLCAVIVTWFLINLKIIAWQGKGVAFLSLVYNWDKFLASISHGNIFRWEINASGPDSKEYRGIYRAILIHHIFNSYFHSNNNILLPILLKNYRGIY